jgi:hypothetical protein
MYFYTYAHVRPDTGEIFYVGKGSNKRAYERQGRNEHWHRTVKKNSGIFEVRILNWFNNEDDAYAAEMWRIAELAPLGHLVNQTKGGDGVDWNSPIVAENHKKGCVLSWTAARKEEHKIIMKEITNRSEVKQLQREVQLISQNDPLTQAKRKKTMALTNSRPEVQHTRSAAQAGVWTRLSEDARSQKAAEVVASLHSPEAKIVRALTENSEETKNKRKTANKKTANLPHVITAARIRASKAVVNLVTGEVFSSSMEAAEFYSIPSSDSVASSCRAHARKLIHRVGPNKYHFAFLKREEL